MFRAFVSGNKDNMSLCMYLLKLLQEEGKYEQFVFGVECLLDKSRKISEADVVPLLQALTANI